MHTGKLRELDSRRELAEFHLANIKLIFQLITLKRTLVLSWVLSSLPSLPLISLAACPIFRDPLLYRCGTCTKYMYSLFFFQSTSANFSLTKQGTARSLSYTRSTVCHAGWSVQSCARFKLRFRFSHPLS